MIPAIHFYPSKDGKNIRLWAETREEAEKAGRNLGEPLKTYYPAGSDNLMIIAAVRYCLGRMTYIVSDCADWLIHIWPALDERTRKVIQRDIEHAFELDGKARTESRPYKPLGMDQDRAQWERVRALWASEASE